MFNNSKRFTVAGATALALGAYAVAVPVANAEDLTNLKQELACNLQLKNPGGIPLGLASSVEGVYNSANPTYSNFTVTLAGTSAPDTVKQGEEFDYVIDSGSIGIPAVIKAAVTANVSKASQVNLWYELPANAEVVEIKTEGGQPGLEVKREGNRLRIWNPTVLTLPSGPLLPRTCTATVVRPPQRAPMACSTLSCQRSRLS